MEGEKKSVANLVLWFAARTGRGQELSIRERLTKLGVECFIPTRMAERTRRGRKIKVETALIPNLVFFQTTKSYALSLVNSGEIKVKFIIDHATKTLLTVPDKQMEDFIRVVTDVPDPICPSDYDFVPGGRVRVVKGTFSGIEGEIVKLPNKTYVVVSLGRLICARVQIPRSYLEPIAG